MEQPVLIRAYRPGDAPAVRSLVEEVLREHGLWGSHKTQLGDLEAPRRHYLAFLIVEAGGKAVGCGGLTPSGFIQRMYLLEKWRGRGLGRKLLQKLRARARKAGLKTLRLETAPRLKTAIALYRSAGFFQAATGPDCCSVKMKFHLLPSSLK